MFKIYDLNLNEIPFPDGVKPLDVIVGSISKRRETEPIPGRSGVMNYGFDYESRPVDLSLWLESRDRTDYRLIRNELYDFIDRNDVFYVCETRLPSRVLKVCIDESYIPDRLTVLHSTVDISCRTLDSVFWESIYTTLELHDSGFSSTPEKYGLVDNIDTNKLQYRFTPSATFNPNLIPLLESRWELGSRWDGGGTNGQTGIRLRTANAIAIVNGRTYHFNDNSTANSNVGLIKVHLFDASDNLTDYFTLNRGGSRTFVAQGTKAVVSIEPISGSIAVRRIEEGEIRIKLEEGSEFTGFDPESNQQTFTIYNAGNVTIEPESMLLDIYFSFTSTFDDNKMTVKNLTTGDTFELNANLNRRHVRITGVNVTAANVNRFRDTNKQFISIAPGDNEFEVTGAIFDEARFNFRYLYK